MPHPPPLGHPQVSWLLEEGVLSLRGCTRPTGKGSGAPKSRSPLNDSLSLPGFLPTRRPEPRPEPRPGPELPAPSIPAWTGPEVPEPGLVEGIQGIDGVLQMGVLEGGFQDRASGDATGRGIKEGKKR